MRLRPFGPNGPPVSEIGLGTWQLGAGWGRIAEDQALAVLEAAAEAGVSFVDTADVYGYGRGERLIGRFLEKRPGAFFVAGKIGLGRPLAGPETFTPETLRAHLLASLERLGLPHLDLLQLHTVPSAVLYDGRALAALRGLRDQGLARFVGASVSSLEEALFCLDQGLDSLQILCNVLRPAAANALFPAAREKGLALVVRCPLASGLLGGKLHRGTTFAKTDHRRFNREGEHFNVAETFSGLPFEKGLELVEELKALRPKNMTLPQMALRFLLDHEAVTTVIPGARSARQVLANASASELAPLAAELHAALRDFAAERCRPFLRGVV